jgi:hypothetical protein
MFDFENLVSSSDADFDVGLLERIGLITIIYKLEGRPIGNNDMITISHKRNIPFNLLEMAQTAVQMKTAGFSSYLIADIMPDDIIPNIQVELARQRKENEEMINSSIDGIGNNDGLDQGTTDVNNTDDNL